jgi:ABC-type glycerol-3-phosphate transport system permease component
VNRRKRLSRIAFVALGIVVAVVVLVPFLWALSASFQTESAVVRRPPSWVPTPLSAENYRYVFTGEVPQAYEARGLIRSPITQEARLLPWGLRNSFVIATSVVLVNLVFGMLAAYTFARERFRWRRTPRAPCWRVP